MSLWPGYPEQEEENEKPKIVAESRVICLDCDWTWDLTPAEAEIHRLKGHDVRPVRERSGE